MRYTVVPSPQTNLSHFAIALLSIESCQHPPIFRSSLGCHWIFAFKHNLRHRGRREAALIQIIPFPLPSSPLNPPNQPTSLHFARTLLAAAHPRVQRINLLARHSNIFRCALCSRLERERYPNRRSVLSIRSTCSNRFGCISPLLCAAPICQAVVGTSVGYSFALVYYWCWAEMCC